MAKKRFTFADAKTRIKELEEQLEAFNLNTDDNVYIPDEGMLFPDGCHATLTNISNVTVFFN